MNSSAGFEIIYKDKFHEIKFEPVGRVLISEWEGFLLLEEIEKGTGLLLKCIKTEKIQKIISVQKRMKVLTKDIREFYQNYWNLEVEKAGIRKIGIVVSEDPFAHNSVKQIISPSPFLSSICQFFQNESQAMAWVNE